MGGACTKAGPVANAGSKDHEVILAERRMSRLSTDGRKSRRDSKTDPDSGTKKRRNSVDRLGRAKGTEPFVQYGAYSQGGKDDWQNQDAYIMVPNINGDKQLHLFGVFDGHGELGKEVANFAKKNFPKCLLSDGMFPSVPATAFKSACETCNNLLRQSGIDASLSGCTCCCVLIIGSEVIACNVGDSRAVIGLGGDHTLSGYQLTTDHTGSNMREKARIQAAGGRIIKNRIYCADSDVPGLIPSRTFGDFAGRKAGIVCTPEITVNKLDEQSNFLAVMSDGVWESVPLNRICQNVAVLRDRPDEVSKRLVLTAKQEIHKNNKYRDDMTCVFITLNQYGKFVAAVAEPLDSEVFEKSSPVILDPNERVAAAIEHCEQLIDEQGIHPDDAPDSVAGLTPEERYKVLDFLHKYRGASPPRSPAPVSPVDS